VSVFMADRDLPGITLEQLAAAQRAAIDTSLQFRAEGKPVRYIRTTWVPGDARVMCLFEAADAKLVEDVNLTAGIPFSRVVEARDLTPNT
jgi:Nickel responsive protein SCO4226-like